MSCPAQALILRPLAPADAALLAALHRETFTAAWDRPWSAQSFAEILVLPGACGLIAALPGGKADDPPEPVGFGLLLCTGEEVELLLLGVRPACRRQGIARRLLDDLLAMAAAAGAARLLLEVCAANAAAVACYRQAGFVPCGKRRDYYAPGQDALIFERFLQKYR
jgi:ribosomal-protein-alanine N-acetyltransferase